MTEDDLPVDKYLIDRWLHHPMDFGFSISADVRRAYQLKRARKYRSLLMRNFGSDAAELFDMLVIHVIEDPSTHHVTEDVSRLYRNVKAFYQPQIVDKEDVLKYHLQYLAASLEHLIETKKKLIMGHVWFDPSLIEYIGDTFINLLIQEVPPSIESSSRQYEMHAQRVYRAFEKAQRRRLKVAIATYKRLLDSLDNEEMFIKDIEYAHFTREPIDKLKEFYSEGVNKVFQLDPISGIKFSKASEKIYSNYGEICIIREYANAVKFLLEKTKSPGAKDYKPEGLLARLLDPINMDDIVRSIENPVFLNYLYEDRLPAYSWSAASGEEMMKALTSDSYRASYEAERRLIGRAVRDIGERYGCRRTYS